jgi:hypothetical protein
MRTAAPARAAASEIHSLEDEANNARRSGPVAVHVAISTLAGNSQKATPAPRHEIVIRSALP